MSEDKDVPKPPKIEIPKRKKVVRRQTVKLPKIKLSDSAAGGSGRTQIPKSGLSAEPKSSTARIDLPPDEMPTLTPTGDLPPPEQTSRITLDELVDEPVEAAAGDSREMTAEISLGDFEEEPANANETMRISIDQEVAEDFQAPSAADSKEITAEIELGKTETGSMGIPSALKRSTSKITLDDEDEDLISMGDEEDDQSEGETVLPGSVGIGDEDLFKSTTVPMGLFDGADAPSGGTVPAGKTDEEILKATTIPMDLSYLEKHDDEVKEMSSEAISDAQKSTTMPMSFDDDDGETSAGGGEDDDIKSGTVPMAEAPPALPKATKPGSVTRKKTMKISRSDVKTVPPTSAGRPRTIKLKKPDEQQLKTVKLQKAPISGEKKTTSRIELPTELQEGHTDPTPSRKKTIKLKRAPGAGAEQGSPGSQTKTLQINRPDRPASPARSQSGDFQIDESAEEGAAIGIAWAIIAVIGLGISSTALFFLYKAAEIATLY